MNSEDASWPTKWPCTSRERGRRFVKLAFAGTSGFAATILRNLIASDHEVGLVISQPDRPRGRGRKLLKPPVAELALQTGLPLRQPARLGEVAEQIPAHDAVL